MFSEAEVKDPRIVTPPVFQDAQQARAAGVKSGTVIKLPTGEIGGHAVMRDLGSRMVSSLPLAENSFASTIVGGTL